MPQIRQSMMLAEFTIALASGSANPTRLKLRAAAAATQF
jgi:hypothetical protein